MKVINSASLKAVTSARVVIASTSSIILPSIKQLKSTTQQPKRFLQTKLKAQTFQHVKRESTPTPSDKTIILSGYHGIKLKSVDVTFPSGSKSEFHYIWLKDHCREPVSCHPTTKQRLVDTALIPRKIKPDYISSDDLGLHVTWSAEAGGYTSFYPWKFLAKHSYEPYLPDEIPQEPSSKIFWTSDIAKNPPTISYEEVVSSEQGVYNWLKLIDTYGFSFVKGIPPSATTKTTEKLLRRIAFIRETHYGGFWDFTADLKHGDLAYSNEELRGHTDTTYFTDACGLQLFHLLSIPSTHEGGKNLLIDGFRAAQIFRALHPDLYTLFSTLPIPSHASGSGSDSSSSGVHMNPLIDYPVFLHDSKGELKQIRWNSDDRAPVGGGKAWLGKMDLWYHAVREWEKILRSEESSLWSGMKMGTAVIFDNHRVLHGRSSFTGERRLCGGYISGDDYRSRLYGLSRIYDPKNKGRINGGVWDEYL